MSRPYSGRTIERNVIGIYFLFVVKVKRYILSGLARLWSFLSCNSLENDINNFPTILKQASAKVQAEPKANVGNVSIQ